MSGGGPKATRIGDGVFRVEHPDGVDLVYVAGPPGRLWAFWNGHVFHGASEEAAPVRHATGTDVAQSLAAPMPATVLKVLVQAGDVVEKGDTLIVLEAMKMELPLRAPSAGRIVAVHCREGELVQAEAVLLDLT